MRETNLSKIVAGVVELGAGQDPTSLWEFIRKDAQEKRANEVLRLCTGKMKDYADYRESVGYIKALDFLLDAPARHRQMIDRGAYINTEEDY